MISNTSEKAIIKNAFGIITNKRVTYYVDKNLFFGNVSEDIPLKAIVSVHRVTDRKILLGFFLCSMGGCLLTQIVGPLLLFLGLLVFWGVPAVNVVTAGGAQTPVRGWPWHQRQAKEFTNALRKQLSRDHSNKSQNSDPYSRI